MRFGTTPVGFNHPAYIIAEGGINHNGSVDVALDLIDAAIAAGANAIKFQKRTPRLCVPRAQWDLPRETPWGVLSYLEYKERMEFGKEAWEILEEHVRGKPIHLTASAWDLPSLDFVRARKPAFIKIPSAKLTDLELLKAAKASRVPLVISTGMSTEEEIEAALNVVGDRAIALLHCNSSYPARNSDLNLSYIPRLVGRYPGAVIGYSGHERGIQTTVAAVALGAKVVERHITLDRTMWGTDQACSLEPEGFKRMVRDIRIVESAMGNGKKVVTRAEELVRAKLRG